VTGITLINGTDENLKIAVFKQTFKVPSLQVLAWKVIALPREGGNSLLPIPDQYDMYINYSNVPVTPYGGIKTGLISIDQTTARFMILNEFTNDGQLKVAIVKRVYSELVDGQILIDNKSSYGVWGHILLDGTDIYAPQIISPGRTLMENIEGSFSVSVIDDFITVGSLIKVRELRTQPVNVNVGDTLVVTGTKWTGYTFNN
jgi:hypothetical protein